MSSSHMELLTCSHSHTRVHTDLNCMTVLCWLKRVMMHTSMKGFGSEKANSNNREGSV